MSDYRVIVDIRRDTTEDGYCWRQLEQVVMLDKSSHRAAANSMRRLLQIASKSQSHKDRELWKIDVVDDALGEVQSFECWSDEITLEGGK